MSLTNEQYYEILARTQRNKLREPPSEFKPCEKEVGKGGLHEQIMHHCDHQWPRWKYIHARTDVPSTIQTGAPDFPVIYLPAGKILIIEAKRGEEKLKTAQNIFIHELAMLGHKVEIVRSFEQFLKLVK